MRTYIIASILALSTAVLAADTHETNPGVLVSFGPSGVAEGFNVRSANGEMLGYGPCRDGRVESVQAPDSARMFIYKEVTLNFVDGVFRSVVFYNFAGKHTAECRAKKLLRLTTPTGTYARSQIPPEEFAASDLAELGRLCATDTTPFENACKARK